MRYLVVGTLAIDTTLIGLIQLDMIPTDLVSLFIQLPLIGLFAWYVLKKDRDTREWIDHLMKEQEKRCSRTTDLFEKIIERQDIKQQGLITEVGKCNKQLALNTATVNESMRLSDLVEQLKELVQR